MHDRPNALELLAVARDFLQKELATNIPDARLRFQTLICANVVSIVERELAAEENDLADEIAELSQLLGEPEPALGASSASRGHVHRLNVQLCEHIRAGKFDQPNPAGALARVLKNITIRKLKAGNPKYLADFTLPAPAG